MLFPRIYFDEGDGGGEGANNNADPGSKGKEGDSSEKAGDKKPDEKPDVEGKDKKGDDKPTVETLTASLTERDIEISKLKKSLGDQGSKMGDLKKIQEILKGSPEQIIDNISAFTGKTFKLAESDEKVDLSDNDAPAGVDVEAAIKQHLSEFTNQIKGQFGPALSSIEDFTMEQKHKDWANLASDRDGLQAGVIAGKMKWNELYHFAAKGKNMAVAIDDAFNQGKVEGVKELQKQLDGDSGRPGSRGAKPRPKKEGQDINNAIKRLTSIRHN